MIKQILIICLGIVQYANAQERANIEANAAYNEHKKQVCEQAIMDLKEGALLVRLNFHQGEIDYYREHGNDNAADKLFDQQAKENREVMHAFAKHYSFTPVYFFDAQDSRKILEGDIASVRFYNDQLLPTDTIKVTTDKFFIAEFGTTEQDTNYYYNNKVIRTESSDNPRQTTYSGGDKNKVSALVIRNKQFEQLLDPFPYYARYAPYGPVKKRYLVPVMHINEYLNTYYDKVSQTQNQ